MNLLEAKEKLRIAGYKLHKMNECYGYGGEYNACSGIKSRKKTVKIFNTEQLAKDLMLVQKYLDKTLNRVLPINDVQTSKPDEIKKMIANCQQTSDEGFYTQIARWETREVREAWDSPYIVVTLGDDSDGEFYISVETMYDGGSASGACKSFELADRNSAAATAKRMYQDILDSIEND